MNDAQNTTPEPEASALPAGAVPITNPESEAKLNALIGEARSEEIEAQRPEVRGQYTIMQIPAIQLSESATNPRKRWGDLDDLVKSIKANGFLSPLIVRERPTDNPFLPGAKQYEIVCGARRFRAGKLVPDDHGLIGVHSYPCDVRVLTDDQAREFQIVENLQRNDLHPMEEAEGYSAMLGIGYTVETLASRMGKSTGWVRNRLQLLELGPEARSAYLAGTIDLSVAYVLGRQLASEQARALPRLEQIATAREQIAFLQTEFARNLKGAPFYDDTTMPRFGVAGGEEYGDCKSCPKNSNNAPRELFGDYDRIDRAGVCSNVPCYRARCDELAKRRLEIEEQKGATVLKSPAQARRFVVKGSSIGGSPFVIATDAVSDDPKRRTWEQVVGDALPRTFILDEEHPGEIIALLERKAAVKLAVDAGIVGAKRQSGGADPRKAESAAKRKEADEKARLVAETVEHSLAPLVAKWRKGLALPELQAAAHAAIEGLSIEQLATMRVAFEIPENRAVDRWVDKDATVKDLGVFLPAALLFPRWQASGEDLDPTLKLVAKSAGVDLAAIGRAQLAALKAAEEAERKANAPNPPKSGPGDKVVKPSKKSKGRTK